jgi:acyl transferase domain-containing protein
MFFTPDSMAPLAHLNFFSPDGNCYSFDSRANGYTRGEGHGIFVLKTLESAIRDRDNVRAIIRATGSQENGRTTGGITKVNLEAQERLIRQTYASASLDLYETRLVEAHGPGTAGDIVECAALGRVFGPHRAANSPLYVGSVKANLGKLPI